MKFHDSTIKLPHHASIPLPDPLPQPENLQSAPPLPRSVPLDDPLQIAIWYHEQNELEISAYYFSHSAALGNSIGLILYAVSLRHGWGVPKNEADAFRLLQKAVEIAGVDGATLDNAGMGTIKKIQTEQVTLAIFEIAMSFRMGWGVPKDIKMAVYYLEIAAKLGDPDAQFELADMYMRGEGVKKSKYTAAQWYRLAEKKGKTGVSMQWIWKSKYDNPEESSNSNTVLHDSD